MPLPNAIYLGAPRAGSKWIYYLFNEHPHCFAPKIPDPFFFDRDEEFVKGIDWYENLFSDAPVSAQIIGEMSHDYLYSETATLRIFNHLENVRLFCTIRHPIERALSHWNFYFQSGWSKSPFEKAIHEHPEILEHSLYAKHLARYLETFGAERMWIGFYDDLAADAATYAKRLFHFLNVEPLDEDVMKQKVNVSRKARNLLLGRAVGYATRAMRKKSMTRLFGAIKKRQQALSLLFFKDSSAVQASALSPKTLDYLKNYFSDDISVIEELTDRDLSSWRDIIHEDTR